MNGGIIVCATRGGEASKKAQDRAIELAKAEGKELIFLYVVDVDFTDGAMGSFKSRELLSESVEGLGHFLLAVAQENARSKGVSAKVAIRQGKVREGILNFVREVKPDLLIIGHPKKDHLERIFTEDKVHPFAQTVEKETGVKVLVVQ